MDRRLFLKSGLAATLWSLLPSIPARAAGRRIPWQNWSGLQRCEPAARVAPKDLNELATIMRAADGPIRPVGAGHSFSPLVPTDGTILSLRHFRGLKSHDSEKLQATFGAGTKLGQIGEALDAVGQALPNMPDIDEQSLAGAIATGTHGTGATLGAMHSYLDSLELVTPGGEVLRCSATQNAEIFSAARVSLGSLGVITEVTLRNVESLKLKRKTWLEPIDQVIERFDELARDNHSFEMYYIPFCDAALVITINPTDDPIKPKVVEQDNEAALELKKLRDYTSWWPDLRRRLLNYLIKDYEPEESVDVWYRAFPSERAVRFNEMEYHMDRRHLIPTLQKVRERIEASHNEVFFPVEVRLVRGDDAWLSPFFGHESGSIAVHRYFEEDPNAFFSDIEPMYQSIEGRPHWGKMHELDATTLASRYPHWNDFLRVRRELDPNGRMLNPHLSRLFGIGSG